ncbi:tubulin--tyrosine ligase-like protein 12 [Porites lutea]|uniref:tubulin--tyrosine ligase-like protein 12 n=1 Tax=Porites lutea TaxID=51062 RepID=UPI003CC597EF
MVDEVEYSQFLAVHKGQLIMADIPEQYWTTLHKKLKNEIYDAGSYFTMAADEEGSLRVFVTTDDGIKTSDPDCVFLIDHSWTYEVNYARSQLKAVPGLADRMALLMGVTNGESSAMSEEDKIEKIFEKMWSYNHSYRIKMIGYDASGLVYEKDYDKDEEYSPLWFVMDEFGSCIRHSDDPTFGMSFMSYVPLGIFFSIIWPLKDLEYGDEVTRNYLPQSKKEPLIRDCCLLPWFPDKLTDKEWLEQLSSEFTLEYAIKQLSDVQMKDWQGEIFPRPDKTEGLTSLASDTDKIYRVFTDVVEVKKNLTHPRFVQVDNKEDADILWIRGHFKDFRSLQDSAKFINQFPNECTLTCKDLLASVCQNATALKSGQEEDLLRRGPEWLPVTFNLTLELPLFIDHYLKRKKRGLDNHWICKPWNLARAIDSHVTSNLNYIIRLRETGPKVACKYIDNPVLFHREDVGRVKFDFRYLVLLSSAKPLVLYADKVFWLRFANQPFSMDSFDVYSKHFTVMNYRDSENLKQVHHHEFIPMFEQQYPNHKWADVEARVFKMFREMFEAAVSDSPPKTLMHCSQSRAFYAVDLMLKWADDGTDQMIPQVLEVNYCADCERACRYHPEFFNYIFSLLFLGDSNGWPVEEL